MAHVPVLLEEVIRFLDPQPGQFIIDGTVNGGGHMFAIAQRLGPNGSILGVDLDCNAIELLGDKVAKISNAQFPISKQFVCGNYADLPAILKTHKFGVADGLLVDLGFSSDQMDGSGRGFSFKEEYAKEPLLMTYDKDEKPVREILRELREEELADIIYRYGEERLSRKIAKAIKERLRRGRIDTAGELTDVVAEVVRGRGKIHPATRVFQALRIYANHELQHLESVLRDIPKILKSGGRVLIISFHSLEDVLVKNAFRNMAKAGTAELLTKKPIVPSREEVAFNPRSRSAKLRAIKLI